jgi:hypothetical protein
MESEAGAAAMFSLELGEEVSNIKCECCGQQFKSVCGFIKKDDDAYSVYFVMGDNHTSRATTIRIPDQRQ